eukprot:2439167-Rhodomonas_salina.1
MGLVPCVDFSRRYCDFADKRTAQWTCALGYQSTLHSATAEAAGTVSNRTTLSTVLERVGPSTDEV